MQLILMRDGIHREIQIIQFKSHLISNFLNQFQWCILLLMKLNLQLSFKYMPNHINQMRFINNYSLNRV